jgi:hypothetical protein
MMSASAASSQLEIFDKLHKSRCCVICFLKVKYWNEHLFLKEACFLGSSCYTKNEELFVEEFFKSDTSAVKSALELTE